MAFCTNIINSNLLLYLTNQDVFEISGGGAIARLPLFPPLRKYQLVPAVQSMHG